MCFTCLYPCILISIGSCVHACILASLHPHILRFICSFSHPCILISLGLCVLACNLVSLHHLILRFTYSVCLLVSSYPYTLISLGSCILGACWYPRILTSSYPQVHVLWVVVGILASSNAHTLNMHFLLIKFS